MGDKHTVRFEPVGLEIEVDEDETVLEAAFRQGVMLMHGCKEGQCAACKSFLLDGDVDLDRYSTFALNEYEAEEGYVLLCRTHACSDLEVELLHYDEEMLRAGPPIQMVRAQVEAVEPLTHDIRRLVVRLVDPEHLAFLPGQYMDITIPGSQEKRAFSMANATCDGGRLEFMIKLYPGGRFSQLLDGGLKPGDPLDLKGPYGMFTLREGSDRPLLFVGGGAGMAPIWSLLQAMADQGVRRPVTFFYGARRRRDLFHLEQLEALGARLPDFRFVPALSEPTDECAWEGEVGLITEAVTRGELDLAEVDAYLCGPPPMVDAALALLVSQGVPEERIFFDKFTITAEAEEVSSSLP
jgi:propane monooxygenase reductase subunit